MLEKTPPYTINRYIDRFARVIWFSPKTWFPAVWLKTEVASDSLVRVSKERKISINAFMIKAAAVALSEFPRLNYYTFWGKLIWAGPKTRVSMICEMEEHEGCEVLTVEEAEHKGLIDIVGEMKTFMDDGRACSVKPTFGQRLMNRFPRLSFYFLKWTGLYAKQAMAGYGPVSISNVNMPGITDGGSGVYYSTILAAGRVQDGKMPLKLMYNHELANARPLIAYLSRVKELLEDPEKYLI